MSQVLGSHQEEYKLSSYERIVDHMDSKSEQKYLDNSDTDRFDDGFKIGVVEYLDEQAVISLSRTSHYWNEFIPLHQRFIEGRAACAEFKASRGLHSMDETRKFLEFCEQKTPIAEAQSNRLFDYIAKRCLQWIDHSDSREVKDTNTTPIALQTHCVMMEAALTPFLKSPDLVFDAFYGRFPKRNIKGYLQRLANQAQQIVQQADWRRALENPDNIKTEQLDQWAFFVSDMQLLEGILVGVGLLAQLAAELEEYRSSSRLPPWQNFAAPTRGALFLHADTEGDVVARAFNWIGSRTFLFDIKAHPRILLVLDDLWCLGKWPIQRLLEMDKEFSGNSRNYLSRLHPNDLLPSLRAGKRDQDEIYSRWYRGPVYSQLWTRLSREDHLFLMLSLSDANRKDGMFAKTPFKTRERVLVSRFVMTLDESKQTLQDIRQLPSHDDSSRLLIGSLDRLPPKYLEAFLLDYFQGIASLADINPWFQVADAHSAFANMDGTCEAVNLNVLMVIGQFFDKNPSGLTKADIKHLMKKAVPRSFNIYFLSDAERTPEKMRFLFGQALSTAQLVELIIRYYVLITILQRLASRKADFKALNQLYQTAIKLLYFESVSRTRPLRMYYNAGLCEHYQKFFQQIGSFTPLSHYNSALTEGREIKPLSLGPLASSFHRNQSLLKELERSFYLFLCLSTFAVMLALSTTLICYLFPMHMGLTIFLVVSSGIAGLFSLGSMFCASSIFDLNPSRTNRWRTAWQRQLLDGIALFFILMLLAMTVALTVMTMNFWGVVAVVIPNGSAYFFWPYFLAGAIASFVLIFVVVYTYQALEQKYFAQPNVPDPGIHVLETLPADELWAPRASPTPVSVQTQALPESRSAVERVPTSTLVQN